MELRRTNGCKFLGEDDILLLDFLQAQLSWETCDTRSGPSNGQTIQYRKGINTVVDLHFGTSKASNCYGGLLTTCNEVWVTTVEVVPEEIKHTPWD